MTINHQVIQCAFAIMSHVINEVIGLLVIGPAPPTHPQSHYQKSVLGTTLNATLAELVVDEVLEAEDADRIVNYFTDVITIILSTTTLTLHRHRHVHVLHLVMHMYRLLWSN
jgi:hypothetical protein